MQRLSVLFAPLMVSMWFLASAAFADCTPNLPLKGSLFVETCQQGEKDCVDASQALYEYFQAQPDKQDVVTVAVQTSPWRFYGPDMRILEVADVA